MAIKQAIIVAEGPTMDDMLDAAKKAFTNDLSPAVIQESTGVDTLEALQFISHMNVTIFENMMRRVSIYHVMTLPDGTTISSMAMEFSPTDTQDWSPSNQQDMEMIAMDCVDRMSSNKLADTNIKIGAWA